MIEQDARCREHVVALAIVHDDPMRIELGDRIRTSRMKRCFFVLRGFFDLAEHFRRRGLIKAGLASHTAQDFQHPQDTHPVNIACVKRLVERGAYKALRCQIVNLVWCDLIENA